MGSHRLPKYKSQNIRLSCMYRAKESNENTLSFWYDRIQFVPEKSRYYVKNKYIIQILYDLNKKYVLFKYFWIFRDYSYYPWKSMLVKILFNCNYFVISWPFYNLWRQITQKVLNCFRYIKEGIGQQKTCLIHPLKDAVSCPTNHKNN